MSSGLRGVIVCHGQLASAMVEAVQQISGMGEVLSAISNDGCDREALRQRVGTALGADPTLVFVDLPTGSCLMAALQELQEEHAAKVVTGVNLSMLLDFVFHRDSPLEDAAARAVEMGAQAIGVR